MYYTPDRLDWWLRNWDLLDSLAESPVSSRHHLQTDHAHKDGPCIDPPKVGKVGKGQHADPLKYADVQADIERAHAGLAMWSLPWNVVDHRKRGHNLDAIAKALRIRYHDVTTGYRDALKTMSAFLEAGES